jgi:hypothetical protein
MSETWEFFAFTPLPHPNPPKEHAWKVTVQFPSEQWTVHSPRQTQLEKKILPHTSTRNKGRPLHSMTQLLISCKEILFLKLAATIFGLDYCTKKEGSAKII